MMPAIKHIFVANVSMCLKPFFNAQSYLTGGRADEAAARARGQADDAAGGRAKHARSPAEVKERQGAFDSFILGMEEGSFPRCTGAWIGAQFSQICVLALLWHGYRFQKLKLGQDSLESKVGIALLCNFNT